MPNNDAPLGCAVFALLLWVLGILITLAFWGLVAYGVWEGIQYLQRN